MLFLGSAKGEDAIHVDSNDSIIVRATLYHIMRVPFQGVTVKMGPRFACSGVVPITMSQHRYSPV